MTPNILWLSLLLLLVPGRAHFSRPRVIHITSKHRDRRHRIPSRGLLVASTANIEEPSLPLPQEDEGVKEQTLKEGIMSILSVLGTSLSIGFFFGAFLGGARGINHLVLKNHGLMGTPIRKELAMRWSVWSSKVWRWGKAWSTATCFFTVVDTFSFALPTKYNHVVAMAITGAFYSRNKGLLKVAAYTASYAFGTFWVQYLIEDAAQESERMRAQWANAPIIDFPTKRPITTPNTATDKKKKETKRVKNIEVDDNMFESDDDDDDDEFL